ncbi:MAG: DUF87 domain-containing protein [bacterium]|nr:DUF87 domain-containing protein [bacterium]
MRAKLALLIVLVLAFVSFAAAAPIDTGTYSISENSIDKDMKAGTFAELEIHITNKAKQPMEVLFEVDGDAKPMVKFDKSSMTVDPESTANLSVTIFAEGKGDYNGSLLIVGDITQELPIDISVSEIVGVPVEALLITLEADATTVQIGDSFRYKIDVQNLLTESSYNVTIKHGIDSMSKNKSYIKDNLFISETETLELRTSRTLFKEVPIPDMIKSGDYVLNVEAEYLGLNSSASMRFYVTESILDYKILEVMPLRVPLLALIILTLGLAGFIFYKKKIAKKRRYVSKLDLGKLPQEGPRSANIGKIAELKKNAFFDIDQLQTHTLIAGSTGGGKTVSAEVLVEEALLKGAAIVVFDPTAQWSGFLRKCQEKKMLELYPQFGLKPSDAKAFNGNVKEILNAREILDIKKYIKPGEINVFAINKLDPTDADILVSNTIREIFHADLPESRELKLIIIFDEVHRLLPKFGGSGQGFIQIERGAREFRKWGVGLMLISQVLSDFVGETKANINTELQMRTRDQGDLDRIKTKYGGYMLQSLLKASTGVGMLQNSAYNNGEPYFIAFRPLLHEHARLTDEELENYNKYNNMIDDLDYQIEQLEKEGLDVFDLKLELKMALDKVKSGSFNMVNIYLDSLTPRLKEQWKKLGKEPKKKEIRLVSEEALKEDFEKAKKARDEEAKAAGGEAPAAGGGGGEEPPLRLKSGLVVTTPTELADSLGALSDEDFKFHVNDQKNDFADWMMKFSESKAKEIKAAKTKEEIVKILES